MKQTDVLLTDRDASALDIARDKLDNLRLALNNIAEDEIFSFNEHQIARQAASRLATIVRKLDELEDLFGRAGFWGE
jgi:hypothetical protein